MTASVRIDLDQRTVLAVPTRAIRQEGGRSVVRVVVAGGGTEARPVRVGWRDGPWAEITEGLVEGDRILLDAPGAGVEGQ
jgi:multidrug efflux pump subunit AcrA (membrane-fusion protein)